MYKQSRSALLLGLLLAANASTDVLPRKKFKLPDRQHLVTAKNASCPCGSGHKYKKCCLVKEQEHEVVMQDRNTLTNV